MGIEKRDPNEPRANLTNEDFITETGPEAPTTDIVDGDTVVKSADEIASEMNAANPEGPEYAPVGTLPDPEEPVDPPAARDTSKDKLPPSTKSGIGKADDDRKADKNA